MESVAESNATNSIVPYASNEESQGCELPPVIDIISSDLGSPIPHADILYTDVMNPDVQPAPSDSEDEDTVYEPTKLSFEQQQAWMAECTLAYMTDIHKRKMVARRLLSFIGYRCSSQTVLADVILSVRAIQAEYGPIGDASWAFSQHPSEPAHQLSCLALEERVAELQATVESLKNRLERQESKNYDEAGNNDNSLMQSFAELAIRQERTEKILALTVHNSNFLLAVDHCESQIPEEGSPEQNATRLCKKRRIGASPQKPEGDDDETEDLAAADSISGQCDNTPRYNLRPRGGNDDSRTELCE